MSQYTMRDSLIEAVQYTDVETVHKWALEHAPQFTFEKVRDFLIIPCKQPHLIEIIKEEIENETGEELEDEEVEQFLCESSSDMVCNLDDYLLINENGYVYVVRKDYFEAAYLRVRV